MAGCGAPDSGVTSLRTSPIAPTTTTTTTAAPSTTTISEPTPTTVKRTTVPAPAPTTSTTLDAASLKADWLPACGARTGAAARPLDETVLDTFGPLAPNPAFTLSLPTAAPSSAAPGAGREPPVTHAARIPGGAIVVVTSTSSITTTTPVIAVNLDGSLRWVQCIEGGNAFLSVAPVAARPDRALLTVQQFRQGAAPTTEYLGVALATGAVVTTHDDIARTVPLRSDTLSGLWTVARMPGAIVLADGANPGDLTNVDSWYRLDLRTFALTSLPVPDEVREATPGRLADVLPTVTPAGELALAGQGFTPPVRAVLRDGQWVRTPAALTAARPTLVTYAAGDLAAPLVGVDALGTELWSRPDLTSPGLQMMATGGTDPVEVVNACVERGNGPSGCAGYATIAIDASTGRDVWRLDGFRQVAMVADGYALVTDAPVLVPDGGDHPDPGWQLVDVRTGTPVTGQAWPADTFRQECCGGGDTVWSRLFGGVVIAANGTRLRVWLPVALGGAGVTVAFG